MFSNVTSPSTKAKLRILFEVAPLGLLVEKAGGASSCDGQQKSTLDVLITKHDQVSKRAGMRLLTWRAATPGHATSCNGQLKSTLDVLIAKHIQSNTAVDVHAACLWQLCFLPAEHQVA